MFDFRKFEKKFKEKKKKSKSKEKGKKKIDKLFLFIVSNSSYLF